MSEPSQLFAQSTVRALTDRIPIEIFPRCECSGQRADSSLGEASQSARVHVRRRKTVDVRNPAVSHLMLLGDEGRAGGGSGGPKKVRFASRSDSVHWRVDFGETRIESPGQQIEPGQVQGTPESTFYIRDETLGTVFARLVAVGAVWMGRSISSNSPSSSGRRRFLRSMPASAKSSTT